MKSIVLLLLGCSILGCHVHSAEPWSDDRLPVQEGVEFWFDCSVQDAARRSLQLPAVATDSGTDFLLDGSGRAHHLAQPLPGARPRFRQESRTAFLSFDGNSNALVGSFFHGRMSNVTAFVVAAPRSNRGGFRAFFGLSRAGANDYSAGLNLDFGPQASAQLAYVNVEGNGMGGAAQLLRSPPSAFGPWHVFSLQSQPSQHFLELSLDGQAQGTRQQQSAAIGMNVFVLGARYFSNTGEPPHAQGFFDGDIAEVLVYARALTDTERTGVEQYLNEKYSALLKPSPESLSQAQPLEPAPLVIPGEPPARKRAEVDPMLNSVSAAGNAAPFQIVLCAGPKDHGPGEHDYPLWQKRWSKLLALAENVKVGTAWEWPSPEQLQTAHVIVFYSDNPGWSKARAAELDRALARGCGLAFLHYAVDGHDEVEALAQRIGLAWRGGFSKFRHGALDLKLEASPLTSGLSSIHFVDESYWNLVGDFSGCQLIGSAVEEGQPRPLLWTRMQGNGRIFANILGHYTWTFDDPLFRIVTLRGICWAGGQPVDRLSELALIGARIEE